MSSSVTPVGAEKTVPFVGMKYVDGRYKPNLEATPDQETSALYHRLLRNEPI
jgi:hypothetical protein